MREVLFGACLAMLMAFGALIMSAWPVPGRPVAALFHDATDSRNAISGVAQAEGLILDVIGKPSWVITVSPRSDFVMALYRHGAWLVIDAQMAIRCFGDRGKSAA